ncbi:MAG: hypothetical protein ACTSPB_13225 [Candidatus Thorarchaeota archaeon]
MISAVKYCPSVESTSWRRLQRGTADHAAFWMEEIRRCKQGYKPSGGTWIPGNYYFYLNYCHIERYDEVTKRKIIGPPSYRDQDHEFFLELNKAKDCGYGLIILKARRKGFSWMMDGVLLHEWTFYPGSHSGVGAENEKYVGDHRRRLMIMYNDLPKELRNRWLHNNSDILFSGYKVKEDGQWIERGYRSALHFRNMDTPDAFRGLTLNWLLYEEAGEWRRLKRAFFANEECFREGDVQFGVPVIGGTANQMNHDNDDYMKMFYNAEDYGLKSLFIPASKVYHGFFDYKTGISDMEGAEKAILSRRKKRKKSGDKESYFSFLQEMPLKPEDAFIQLGNSPFDVEKIMNRKAQILGNKEISGVVRRGTLKWPKDKAGKDIFGGNPIWVPDPSGPIEVVEPPLPNLRFADVSAVDPYHIDDELEDGKIDRDSKGCMVVYRRFVSMNTPGEMPICIYRDRPYSKSDFYEMCLKIAIFYNTQILVEYNDDGFLKFFLEKRMGRYLKERPQSADAPYSKVSNRYGIHMKVYQKKLAVELIDEYIKKHCDDIYFLSLLDELQVFGKKNTDIVMAFGMALIHDMDSVAIRTREDEEANNNFAVTTLVRGDDGNLKLVSPDETPRSTVRIGQGNRKLPNFGAYGSS